ncbi:MAG TPA: HAD-IIA family hydrolase [Candidatus Hydrogenedentes bacterium]|jgi:HAD superfamily hydrolase (TIGR01450 family)|nr:HAD-IIA family hydrolase [Candidatus Hydrogenedentota bacterium]HPK00405.1 HAD-IIA family hydrolase [Candidatus Hydrogenedentota bacterium]
MAHIGQADETSRKRLAALRHFLLDLDGTLYLGSNPIDGAAAFVRYLVESGRKRLFFTNNCSVDAAYYEEKLARMGIPAARDDILTSGEATVRYLATGTPYRRVFVLGTPSFEAELRAGGLTLVDDDAEAVVLAFDRTLTYAKLETACGLLRDGVPYFATNPDKVCPTATGYIPDCGSMAALLFESTGRWPKYIGKPNPEMVAMGLQKLGGQAQDKAITAMVGDRLYTDIQMARQSGIAAILVLSGETRESDLANAEQTPDYVFASVKALHAALRDADRAMA